MNQRTLEANAADCVMIIDKMTNSMLGYSEDITRRFWRTWLKEQAAPYDVEATEAPSCCTQWCREGV